MGRKRRNTKAYIQCDSISIRLKRRPNQAVLFRATDLGGAQKSGWWSPLSGRGDCDQERAHGGLPGYRQHSVSQPVW